jgi:hypothetical protein
MSNYLATANPFNLAAPPASFLRDLLAYDSKLVIFPSKKEPVYRLCRKASLDRFWMAFDKTHPDAETCIAQRVIPLKAIMPNPQWGQTLISALAACDVQRVGGGVAADELLKEQEQLEERRQQIAQDDECDARSHEAYRGLQAQLGQRIHVGLRKPEGAGGTKNPLLNRTSKPRRVYRPRGTGDHALFVGR